MRFTQYFVLRRSIATVALVSGIFALNSVLTDSSAEAKLQHVPAPPVPYAKNGTTFEIRMYKIQPGKMDAYVKNMSETIVPYQESIGMRHVGQFVSGAREVGGKIIEDTNTFVWIRAYPDEETRQRQYRDYYGSQWYRDHMARDKAAGGYMAGGAEVLWVAPIATSKLR